MSNSLNKILNNALLTEDYDVTSGITAPASASTLKPRNDKTHDSNPDEEGSFNNPGTGEKEKSITDKLWDNKYAIGSGAAALGAGLGALALAKKLRAKKAAAKAAAKAAEKK